VLHNYAHILELLLRLRQACDHPNLVVSSRTKSPTDVNQIIQNFLRSLKKEESSSTSNTSSSSNGNSSSSSSSSGSSNSGGHLSRLAAEILQPGFKEQLQELLQDSSYLDMECSICMDVVDSDEDIVVTPCCHLFCRNCIETHLNDSSSAAASLAANGSAGGLATGIGKCPTCEKPVKIAHLIPLPKRKEVEEHKARQELQQAQAEAYAAAAGASEANGDVNGGPAGPNGNPSGSPSGPIMVGGKAWCSSTKIEALMQELDQVR
jgi:hypothetical protein